MVRAHAVWVRSAHAVSYSSLDSVTMAKADDRADDCL